MMLKTAQPEEISYEDLDVKEVIGAGKNVHHQRRRHL